MFSAQLTWVTRMGALLALWTLGVSAAAGVELNVTTSTELDTSRGRVGGQVTPAFRGNGRFVFDSLTVHAGQSLELVGSVPADIRVLGPVTIDGVVALRGRSGGLAFVNTFGASPTDAFAGGGMGGAGGCRFLTYVLHGQNGGGAGGAGGGRTIFDLLMGFSGAGGGGGGGNLVDGQPGAADANTPVALGGPAHGTFSPWGMLLGGGGGGGGSTITCSASQGLYGAGAGGSGGGALRIHTLSTLAVGLTGTILADGGAGGAGAARGGGGGAGGTVILIAEGGLTHHGHITVAGGLGAQGGGAGSPGIVFLGDPDGAVNGTGTVTPAAQISTLPTDVNPVSLTHLTLPNGGDGLSYQGQLAAHGGLPPYVISHTHGTLPNGLVFNPQSSTLSGTWGQGSDYSAVLGFTVSDASQPPQTHTRFFLVGTKGHPFREMAFTMPTLVTMVPGAAVDLPITFHGQPFWNLAVTLHGSLPGGVAQTSNIYIAGTGPTVLESSIVMLSLEAPVLPSTNPFMEDSVTLHFMSAGLELRPIGSRTVGENSSLAFEVVATDQSGLPGPLVFAATNLPPGAAFDSNTRLFSWTPTYQQAGLYSAVDFSVTNGTYVQSEALNIRVLNVNRPPEWAPVPDQSVLVGQPLSIAVSASDLDGEALTYSAPTLPPGAVFENQVFSWTPTAQDVGTHPVILQVTDGLDPLDESFEVTVMGDGMDAGVEPDAGAGSTSSSGSSASSSNTASNSSTASGTGSSLTSAGVSSASSLSAASSSAQSGSSGGASAAASASVSSGSGQSSSTATSSSVSAVSGSQAAASSSSGGGASSGAGASSASALATTGGSSASTSTGASSSTGGGGASSSAAASNTASGGIASGSSGASPLEDGGLADAGAPSVGNCACTQAGSASMVDWFFALAAVFLAKRRSRRSLSER